MGCIHFFNCYPGTIYCLINLILTLIFLSILIFKSSNEEQESQPTEKESESQSTDKETEYEEEISKNLDFYLKNNTLLDFDLDSLNRILNSKKRVLNDHHLLFEFIKKIISRKESQNYKKLSEVNEDQIKLNIQLLLNSLDYTQMSNDELIEIIKNDELSEIFQLRENLENMKILLKENQKLKEQIETLKKLLIDIQQSIKTTIVRTNDK